MDKPETNSAIIDESSSDELETYFSDKKDGDPVDFRVYGTLRSSEGKLRHVQFNEIILPEKYVSVPVDEDAERDDLEAVAPIQ